MSDIRAPQIIEGQIQGKNQIQIAEDLGISRRTVQRDIQTPVYDTLIAGFFQKYQDKLTELLQSEQVTVQLEILKELGRMYRAGMTKTTRHTEDIKLTADLTITEQRKEKSDLVDSLELTEDQYKILDAQFKTKEED